MGKLYTLDNKLLCGSPEIRIGDKVFSIDDRKNTVKEALKLFENKENSDMENFDKLDELLKLAFGKDYKKIEALELSFAAYNELSGIIIAAMTGEEPDEIKKKKDKKEQSFPESNGDVV